MPRITVNVSEEVEEWLESEAERLHWSKADAGGHCIELLYSDVNQLDVQHITMNQSDAPTDRLDELEARVAALEERDESAVTPVERTSDTDPVPESSEPEESHTDDETPPLRGDVDETIREIVADVSASWDDDDRLDDRRAAATAALQLMRERGELGRKAAVAELYEEYQVAAQNERTWWRQNIRDAVKQAGSYSNGRAAYVWDVDEPESDGGSGVYDPTNEFE